MIGLSLVDLVYLCRAGCRHLLVPQNSRHPWDLKWSKSMGTWAWALLMCPGGPNHCRVGWAGSHSYSLSVECRTLLPGAWCAFMLGRYVCCGVSCMHCVRRRVAMLSIMSLLPSYTIFFFLHLLCEACCRNETGGSLQGWGGCNTIFYGISMIFWNLSYNP